MPTIANTEDVMARFVPGSTAGRILGTGLENVRSLLPKAAGAGVAVLAGTDLGLRHGAVAMEALRLHSYGLDGPSTGSDAAGPAAYRYLGLEPFSTAPRPTLSSLPTTLRPIPPFFCRPWRG